MKQLIKITFASMLGTFLALLFLFVVAVSSIAALSMSSGQDWEADLGTIKDKSVLRIVFDGPLRDHLEKKDLFSSIINYDQPPATGLYELTQVLEEAALDKKVKGLFLHFKNFKSGMANATALRRAIVQFKKSGKFVIAYSEIYSEPSYLVATAADEIVLYPKGYFEWDGLYSKMSYFKGTLNKLTVVPQIFRVGRYKSAIEPFITDKMSSASREQVSRLMEGMWQEILKSAREKTKLEASTLDNLANDLSVIYGKQAFEKGFVSLLGSIEEVEVKLTELSGADEEPHYVSWKTYYKTVVQEKEAVSDNKIALVFAGGEITSGAGDGDGISSDSLVKLIHKIRRDKDVKAVVFRVNSPGGSALASDVIWTGTQWLKDAKPVVTSFGNVAASGGYYMSAGSQYIFAEPTTITGSIGVFGLGFATEKFWNNRLGVTFDTAKSHKFADLEALVRKYNPEEFAKMQNMVDEIYEDFLDVVLKGRLKLTERDQVHEVAQGRVWLGLDAKEKGLVDELGGLKKAIAKAAELAKLTEYSVDVYPKERSAFEEFFKKMGEASIDIARIFVPEPLAKLMKAKSEPLHEKVKARLPFDLEIR